MPEVTLAQSLTQALTASVQAKVNELGWGAGGDNTDLAEYIILMLSSGKDQSSIATELATDLLGLEADDRDAHGFSAWLFQQVDMLQTQAQNASAATPMSAPGIIVNPNAHSVETGAASSFGAAVSHQTDAEMTSAPHSSSTSEITAPTGPRSMRNGANPRGGRDKRMLGQINRTLDRSHDSVLHRVRGNGNDRINSHGRGPPTGPRGNGNRMPRSINGRAANIAHGLAAQGMNGVSTNSNPINNMNSHPQQGPPVMNINSSPWMMQTPPQVGAPQDPNQMQMVAMLEQQSRLIQQLHHQQQMLMNNQGKQNNRGGHNHRGGRGGRGGIHHQTNGRPAVQQLDHIIRPDAPRDSEDVDMSHSRRDNTDPDETVCKYNLRCTNKDCKFAHQSPAAPPGITMDVNDVCSFGAACKNKKCVGRHPSPAAKMAHQSEQDCKFYPNCTNPHCPFRHPPPPCRNGGDCTVANCKFTHLDTMCKYRPCTNRFCKFKHEDGQRGVFHDKVWVPGGEAGDAASHLSERKFVDDAAGEETVMADDGGQDHDVALEAIN